MTAPTTKTGRVLNVKDVRGLMEYRFVAKGWVAPLEHLMWFEFDLIKHADEYMKWREDIVERRSRRVVFCSEVLNEELSQEQRREAPWCEGDFTVTWYKDQLPFYVARINYDAVERPVLVVIGGFV